MQINGKFIPCFDKTTVHSLLLALGHDPSCVAIEKNGRIVPRARFADEPLCSDDVIEIVRFVGGG